MRTQSLRRTTWHGAAPSLLPDSLGDGCEALKRSRPAQPLAEIEKHENFLPHWEQPGAAYFLTFHVADSIPAQIRARWHEEREAWRAHHPEPWAPEVEQEYHRRFSGQIDAWLDAGEGACWLRAACGRTRGLEGPLVSEGRGGRANRGVKLRTAAARRSERFLNSAPLRSE